ncbi:hypothetical protein [Roseimicrobium sp. ORNL1]|uniref:hypothetical protein n=1 Tax=Roseimicrobium sp. ORNL1 TaxID=2711231 RepID=UPI0013E1F9BB|nr:hypothetical protein [Roseimicrobium sp. ORNL1]QIF01992.1 hypothetical protein G5S37_10765 [Roseimicrobium sp. ORNL1]
MSRRAKLIFVAIFLALLSVPAIYLGLTWHPQSPLRFIPTPGEHAPVPVDNEVMVPLTIENTSRAPIHLLVASFYDTSHTGKSDDSLGVITPELQINSGISTSPEYILIPASGQFSGIAMLDHEGYTRLRDGSAQVEYLWASRIKYQAIEALDHLRTSLSPTWYHLVPEPTIGQDRTTLQLPPAPPLDPSQAPSFPSSTEPSLSKAPRTPPQVQLPPP